MADVAIRIVGDPSSGSAAIDDVAIRAQRAMDKAAQISARMDQVDKQRSAEKMAIANATTAAETTAAQRRFDAQERLYQRLAQAKETADQRVVDSERRVTRAVEKEAKQQGDARAQALKQAAGAFVGGVGAGPAGAIAGGLLGGVNPAVVAAGAAGTALRASIEALTGAVAQARELALVLGSTNEQASLLVGIGQRLGVSSDAMATGMKNMAVATENSPELFQALGVALKDAEGNARPLNDVIADTRDRMSKAGNDTKFMAWATALAGRSAIDILPWLKADSDQVKTLGDETARSGDIIGKDMVDAATRWNTITGIVTRTLQNMGQNFATQVVPLMVNGALAIGQAFDWIGTAVEGLGKLDATPKARGPNTLPKSAGTVGDLDAFLADAGRAAQAIKDFLGNTDPTQGPWGQESPFVLLPPEVKGVLDKAGTDSAARAAELRRLLKELADSASGAGSGGGGGAGMDLPNIPKSGTSGPAPRDTVSDAVREQIDVIREASEQQRQRAQDELDADQKRQTSALDLAEVLRKSTASVYDAEIKGIQKAETVAEKASAKKIQLLGDELDARQRLRDANVAALSVAQQAADDAFNARQTQRDADTQALQDQLADIGKVDQAAAAAAALAAAQKAVADEQAKDMTRVRSESLTDYQKRVADHTDALVKLEKDLADVQTQQAEDVARATLQAKIDGISRAGNADKAAAAVSKRATDDRIAEIRKLSDTDRTATNDQIENARRLRQTQKETTDAQIEGLQEEAASRDGLFARAIAQGKIAQQAAKEKADTEIAESRRATDAIIADLQKQMAARQPGAGAGAGVTSGAPITLPYQVPGPSGPTNTVMSGEYAQAKAWEAQGPGYQWNWTAHNGFYSAPSVAARPSPAPAAAPSTVAAGRTVFGYFGGMAITEPSAAAMYHAAGIPGFALGGSLTLTEPSAIVGMHSGRLKAIAGEAGIETATFTPGAGGRGGGSGGSGHGHDIYMDSRLVARLVGARQGPDATMRGYARRR